MGRKHNTEGTFGLDPSSNERSESAFREYLNNTTIHGLREFMLPVPILFRIIWALVILLALGYMSYQISDIIIEYKTGSTITKITTRTLTSTAALLFCPPSVFDYFKVEALDPNPTEMLNYFWGFLVAGHSWDENSVKVTNQISSDSNIRERYTKILRMFDNDFTKLMGNLSFDEESNFSNYTVKCDQCENQPNVEKEVLAAGICYFINEAPLGKSMRSLQESPKLEININVSSFAAYKNADGSYVNPYSGKKVEAAETKKSYFPSEESMKNIAFTFFFGDQAFQQIGTSKSALAINLGRDYDIFLTTFAHELLSGCSKEMTKPQDCRARCLNESIFQCSRQKCHAYIGKTSKESNKQYCNMKDPFWGQIYPDCVNEAYMSCIKGPCQSPCTQYTFQPSIFPSIPHGKSNSKVIIRPMGANSVLTMKEVKKYTFSSFVSNFGGLVGLFCGASVISVFHIFYYIAVSLYRDDKPT